MGLQLAKTPVAEVAIREPVRIGRETSVAQAIRLLGEHGSGAALVEDDEGRLAGVLSEHDLVAGIHQARDSWRALAVGAVMTRDPQTVSAGESIGHAIGLMQQGALRHLPIVDEENRPTGILSVRDILVFFADNYPQEFLNLPCDPRHESSGRWGG